MAGKSKIAPFKEELIHYYKEGNSIKECALRFGSSYTAVYYFLIRNGVTLRNNSEASKTRWAKDETPDCWEPVKDEVVRLYQKGHSLKEIAVKMKFSSGTARNCLVACGVTLRTYKASSRIFNDRNPEHYKRGFLLQERLDVVVAMHEAGYSPKEIGECFDVSRQTIGLFLTENKIESRTQSEAAKLGWHDSKGRHRATADPGPYLVPEEPAKQSSFGFLSTETHKYCKRCKKDVPESGWPPSSWSSHKTKWCRECWATYTKDRPKKKPTEESRLRHNAQIKDRQNRIRLEVLAAYGNSCACCGESRHEFLVIDHIHGKGCNHRRYVEKQGCNSMYLFLYRNGFPPGFRALCVNCNSALGFYGYCPHQEPRDFLDAPTPSARWSRKLRMELLNGYGACCACCGEKHPEFLALDHVNGGGLAHHKKLRAEGITYKVFIRSVIDAGFPADYRLLCHSCNCSKAWRGYCPHDSDKHIKA